MITDFIINVFLALPMALLDLLPDIDISINDNVFYGIETFVCNVAYIFPIKALMPIIIISSSLINFDIIWSIILRLKSFIPTMGG